MKSKKILIHGICILLITFTATRGYACDPRRECLQGGPDYPCPTWQEPLRLCHTIIEDPVCVTGRLACQSRLAVCIADLFAGSVGGVLCGACITTAAGAGALPAANCVNICGITTVAIEQAVQQCTN